MMVRVKYILSWHQVLSFECIGNNTIANLILINLSNMIAAELYTVSTMYRCSVPQWLRWNGHREAHATSAQNARNCYNGSFMYTNIRIHGMDGRG